MIGLDTNVLIRYLVQDDKNQAEQASNIIERAVKKQQLIFINQIVLCELVWVLNRAYNFGKEAIIEIIEKILLAKQFQFENKNTIWNALDYFKNSRADFSDCLLGVKNHDNDCLKTVTFDCLAASLAFFELI